ncbi:MAG: hypothetical protein A2X76_01275 [Lysobacterales bacterium GWF1_69_6]|nr:MAG: hypothetical protein A2X76_01275 [Xanthomonadales bacterium GWF1_69_6]
MADKNKQLFSVTLADNYQDREGKDQTNFREIAVGFANSKGGLAFTVPAGLAIQPGARIVIFPIESKD